MNRDTVKDAFELLGAPVEPAAELTELLFARLIAEAERALAGPAPPPPKPRLRLPRGRYLALAGTAAALVALLVVVTTTMLSRPASALAVIREAQRAFATIPPFRATILYDRNPEGSSPRAGVPMGATATVEFSYGGDGRFRQELVRENPALGDFGGPGGFQVSDGARVGLFDPTQNIFFSFRRPSVFEPLR